MVTDLCPWLGIAADPQVRHTEPSETHLCYAQEPAADIGLGYQRRFCLEARHRECSYYHVPPAAAAPAPLVVDSEDEVGPLPSRTPLRIALWAAALVVTAAMVLYYLSGLLAPAPAAPPSPWAGQATTAATEASPAETPAEAVALPEPILLAGGPTATMTPPAGDRLYTLSPGPYAAGWVASDETRGSGRGDSFLYAGAFDGAVYHGYVQFDLSAVPRGATIHAASLELTGLDDRRLGEEGEWQVRILDAEVELAVNRLTFQALHNAAVQWTLMPVLGVADLEPGRTNSFALAAEQLRELEQQKLDGHTAVWVRLDGPLGGEANLFAWDSGYGAATKGNRPRLLISAATPAEAPPGSTAVPTETAVPMDTPEWVVVTSTPTPANAVTAAAIAARETVWATTTGTATASPPFVATATPAFIVVTNTPTPQNQATAAYQRSLATANIILTGTPTTAAVSLVTATTTPRPTSTPRPTRTPIVLWLDEVTLTPGPTPTPQPTLVPMPDYLRNKIAFLSDRTGQTEVFVLDPASGRLGLLTGRAIYEQALAREGRSPDGEYRSSVTNGDQGVQVYVTQLDTGITWAVTFAQELSYDPAWSPKGDSIAYVSQEMGPANGADEIFVVNPQGKEKKRLTFNTWEWDKHPTFSPDGSQIVFYSNRGSGRRQLWVMNADGSNQRVLLPSAYNDWDPVWIK